MIIEQETFEITNYFNASLQINGKLFKTNTSTPIVNLVRVYNKKTGKLLSQGYSKEDGSFTLFGSTLDSNYIVAIDETNEFNSTIKDNIK